MPTAIPEGFEPLSPLSREVAEQAVDRTLRTTHDAIRFVAALAEALGSRGWEDEWVRPGGDRRLYAFDSDRPGWLVAQPIVELVLDVAPPREAAVILPDGTRMKPFAEPPRAQPEGPDQRSAELRLIAGERVAQWAYDAVGRARGWMRGRGDLNHPELPFLSDTRRLDRDQQRPHPLFLRPELDADGHSPRELAALLADLDFGSCSAVRVWMPHPVPGGPALSARRAVGELRRASFEGRWSYPAAGWVVLDGYLGEVVATGATFESAFAQWQDAVRAHDPEPRDSRMTPEEVARAWREVEEEDEPPPETEVETTPEGLRMTTGFTIRWVPPWKMPFPPRRPDCVPAVAIRLPEAPPLPEEWRAVGFSEVVRLVDEEGTVAHGFLAREARGEIWFVGEIAARHLEPSTFRDEARATERRAEERDAEIWGDLPGARTFAESPWASSWFSVLAPGGRALGPMARVQRGAGPSTDGFEPPAAFAVVWSRPNGR